MCIYINALFYACLLGFYTYIRVLYRPYVLNHVYVSFLMSMRPEYLRPAVVHVLDIDLGHPIGRDGHLDQLGASNLGQLVEEDWTDSSPSTRAVSRDGCYTMSIIPGRMLSKSMKGGFGNVLERCYITRHEIPGTQRKLWYVGVRGDHRDLPWLNNSLH